MCGNFGLLLLGYKIDTEYSKHTNAQIVDLVSNNTNQSRELMNEHFIGSSALVKIRSKNLSKSK